MHRIDDHYTENLFDPWYYLGPKRRRLLEKGWPGLFRNYLFDELPIREIQKRFHDSMGRPSKELYAMLGTLILQQLYNLTDEETVEAFAFRTDWHFALDIRDESDQSMYVCERTLREYRSRAIELKVDDILFSSLTDTLLKAFSIPTGKQRLDSTHLHSNMKRLSRLNLFVKTIEKFLKELQRFHPRVFSSQVDSELAARYLDKEKKGCFSRVSGEEARQTLESVAQDLLQLARTFESHSKVKRLKSFGLLQRVLHEQCQMREEAGKEIVILKDPDKVSSDSLQNPSDPDATYDGHKGQGYQAQIMETYQEVSDSETEDRQPNLITYIEVEAAHERDENAVIPAIQETKERACAPEKLLTDTAYGSDENVNRAAKENVDVIAPTKGKPKRKEEQLILDDFAMDEKGAIRSCPAGETPIKTQKTPKGNYKAKFDAGRCRRCELRDYCKVGSGDTNYRLDYTAKELRLAKRRVVEETEEFREKYKWRSGIEATNAKLKSKLGLGRLRVRSLGPVRFAVKLKALAWNILQAVRAKKSPITIFFHRIAVQSPYQIRWGTDILHSVRLSTLFSSLSVWNLLFLDT